MLTANNITTQKDRLERGLQRLAGAVLIQALEDASSGPRRAREDAWEWFDGRSRGEFNFAFCCSLLDRDPEDVRQRLQRSHFIPKVVPASAPAYASSLNYLPE